MGKIRKIFIIIICLMTLFIVGCKKDNNENQDDKLISVEISEKSQTEFNEDNFDISKIILKLIYKSNVIEEKNVTKEMVKTNLDDILTCDSKTIVISYEGFTVQTTVTIKHPVKLESIKISEYSILEFNEGEFDSSFIILDLLYSDKSTREIEVSDEMITKGLDLLNNPGTHQIEITYEEKTINVTVEIIALPEVVNVEFSDFSIKSFEQNKIDYSKMLLHVTYDNNTTRQIPVTSAMIESDINEINTVGIHNISISYKGFYIKAEIIVTPEVILEDFIYDELPYKDGYSISGYVGNNTSVVIPSYYNDLPVREISSRAFYENSEIVRVIIPEKVTKINEAAFYKTTNLSSVLIFNENIEIENYSLATVKLIYLAGSINPSWPEKWYDAQNSYIQENADLKTLKFDGEYEYFIKNKELCVSNYIGTKEEIIVPDKFSNMTPTILGGACFKANDIVKSIILPDSIKVIETYGIAECTSLTNLKLPSNLEILGDYSIRGCTILEHISLPSTLKEIKQNAFNMCSSLQEMIIPSGVEVVEGYAFAWCVKLTKIYIPKTVLVMGAGACYACSKATIYLEGPRIPDEWVEGWNMSNRPIKYNQTI